MLPKGDDVPDTPTPFELAREIAALEKVVERDRKELRDDLRDGFARVENAIAGLNFVPREVYELAMQRLDQEMEQLKSEVSQLRRVFVGGFLVVIAAGVAVAMLTTS